MLDQLRSFMWTWLDMRPIAPYFVTLLLATGAIVLLYVRVSDTQTYKPPLVLLLHLTACGAVLGLALKLPEAGASTGLATLVAVAGGIRLMFVLRSFVKYVRSKTETQGSIEAAQASPGLPAPYEEPSRRWR